MRSTRSSARAPATLSGDDAVLAEMQFAELPVRIVQFVGDRSGGLGPAAADLGLLELEAAHRFDADAMLRAGNRVHDRLAALFDVARHLEPRHALVDVDVEVDVGEH